MHWSSCWGQSAIAATALLSMVLPAGMAGAQSPQSSPAAQTSPSASPRALPYLDEALSQPGFIVAIDPGHGGDDTGSALAGSHWEKDITLAMARELRRQLQEHGIAAQLLRESDVTLSLERRAEAANQEHANLYLALHAGPPGKGIRVYAPALANTQPPALGAFVPWENAQAQSLAASNAAAAALTAELRKSGMRVSRLSSSLRPLNNVVMPAIAVEWAPGSEDLPPAQIQKIENTLVSLIAAGVAQIRAQTGARH